MATVFKTRPEQRLEQLEALRRPLTQAESAELRRCLHTIYMRNWRLELSVRECAGDLLEVQKAGKVETNAIAYRMENAFDNSWPEPKYDRWQNEARDASDMLRDAILAAQARAAAA